GDSPDERGERYDAARVIGEAATLISTWEEHTGAPPPRIESVVVDDYQEASAALVRLLSALADRGTQLVLVADPDVAVQTFRGARPQFVGRAEGTGELGGFGAARVVLPTVYRGTPALRRVVDAVVSRAPSAGVVEHRRAAVSAEVGAEALIEERRTGGTMPTLTAVRAESPGGEAAAIAFELRHAHLHGAVPWEQMAVVVRSSGVLRDLQRRLRAFHIPVTRGEAAVVLRDEPAVGLLLDAIEAGRLGLDGTMADRLLRGSVGRLDDVGIRRLRRAVLARKDEFEPDTSIDDALVELLSSREGAASLPEDLGDAAVRVFEVVDAARAALGGADSTPQQVLWAVWEASGLAGRWRTLALGGGPLADRADADLDAVMALFELAENFELRVPGADAGEFVAHVRGESLPSDTLAESGSRKAGVEVLTAAQAAGRQWEIVVVSGLQEGSWPDTRIRDSVLGAGALAEIMLGRHGLSSWAAREQVLADEWRMLSSAVSRAARRLIVTAVEADDLRPSIFFDQLADRADVVRDGRETSARRLDLRGFVAELRARVEEEAGSGSAMEAPDTPGVAAGILGILAGAGVPGAAPSQWAGLAHPSSEGPIYGGDDPVWVSPSKLESVTTCALRWALETAGGRSAGAISQSLGNLIHEIASKLPQGPRAALQEMLEEKFDSLGLPEGWVKETTRARAREMVERLATYMEGVPGRVAPEVLIRQQVGDAVISGFVDRLEWVDGGVRVVDLKTGSTLPSRAEGEQNPQLASYQLAIQAGAGLGEERETSTPTGARLVFVSAGATEPTMRPQPGLDDGGGWARELLDLGVTIMRGTEFAAQVNPGCRTCQLRRSCPAQDAGRRASQ
ncbi:MAG: PD-(D/E)XK nuclease family protein, partial [bacterium]|nr:PD-(D/E)XK nuclease family protein [bacterium]